MNWAPGMIVALFLLAGGCSEVDVHFHAGTLTINQENFSSVMTVGEDVIDCAEIVGFDAQGNQIYGPVRETFGSSIRRTDVPVQVKSVTVDYLRNCGYPLKTVTFATDFEDDGLHTVTNPVLQNHPVPTTTWAANYTPAPQADKSGALRTGAPTCALKLNDACFKIKGMCYSPAPINSDMSAFPGLGDLFWDNFSPQQGGTVWNWYSLWGYGHLYDNFYARDDLGTMRNDLGVNAIRVYAFMSRQPQEKLPRTNPPNYYFVDDPSTTQHFLHKDFLDKCYNNGNNPIYVLVGLPMAKPLFQKGLPLATNEQKFWEYILAETAKDLGSHPAVMGFTIMNEENAVPWSHLDNGDTASSDKTDQFYYTSISYGNTVKAKAPGKLVGWATTNCPQLYRYASIATFASGSLKGKTYLGELSKAFNYWGVNAYEKTSLDSILGTNDPAYGLTFRDLPEDTKKPVIFTELGWPSTGRVGDVASGAIMYNDTTGQRTAEVLSRMYGLAYGATYSDLFAGAFYFEFSDEWWKSGQKAAWNATNVSHEDAWPNFFNDQEGYGLYAAHRGEGKENADDIWCGSGPCMPQDKYEPRLKVTDAFTKALQNVSQ
jgi:hypothetical protein